MCPVDHEEPEHLALTAIFDAGQEAPKPVYDGRYTRIIFSDKAEERDRKGNIKLVPITYRHNCLHPKMAGIDKYKESYDVIMDIFQCEPEHAKRLRIVIATAWSKAMALAKHRFEPQNHNDV